MLPSLWRYFGAAFFSLNAINTVLVFMAVYAKQGLGFSEARMVRFFLFSQVAAVAGALVFARLIPRWGAKRALGRIWAGWLAALVLIGLQPQGPWVWVAGPVIGFCLGPTWATGRVLVMELAPKDHLAEMFGLAGLFARASTIAGPLLWGLLIKATGRYEAGLAALMGLLAVGIWLLRRVPEPDHP